MTWHGDHKRHSDVQKKSEDKDTLRTPMTDTDFGRDYRIDVKGVVVIPSKSIPKVMFVTEQAKWDDKISPTIPANYQPRYWKHTLISENSPEYVKNKDEFKWWKLLKDNIAGIIKRHQSKIPKLIIHKIDIQTLKGDFKVEDELSPEYNRIVGVGIYFGRGIYNTYILSETHIQNERFNKNLKRYSISEIGSPFVEKLLNRYPNKKTIEQFYDTISNLVQTYQVFLLGREGLQAYYETAEDRRLVDALSHGATMDGEGYIVDPVTGDKF